MQTIASAEYLASDYLVTFGVVPVFPHTGYGYIKPSEACGPGYRVSEFREKPNRETAEKYIQEGCLWNSGMFLFDTELFFDEVKKNMHLLFSPVLKTEMILMRFIRVWIRFPLTMG